ncbi:MAG TPA: secondary thiamine-phosphate synthase enzyme YjbQ [Halanaerobiales bacterium]|nr:secondary thiamine-phosphate synthase enzyme YjbQ [Halanaerobiales bacterium]
MFFQKKVKTKDRVELVDITKKVKKLVEDQSIKSGILVINIPHTTAGVTINENADPSVKKDIVNELNKVIPFNDNYNHLEGNSAAHIKSSIIGSDQIIIIENGKLQLGRWQGIFFCEFDGPRNRKMNFKIIES